MAVSVLALRAAGMGDLLVAVPALRALGDYAPAGTGPSASGVWVAAPRWLHPLVRLVPGIRGHVGVQGLRPRWAPPRPLAVNLHGCGPQSHAALLELSPAGLLAFRSPGIWDEGPTWFDEEPERDRWCRLLTWAGIPADPRRLEIRRPPIAPPVPGAVVLHLGAGDGARRWPAARFAEVATMLPDHPVVLTGTAQDLAAAAEVQTATRLDPRNSLVARLDIRELAALVAGARLVVSGDSGVSHLASAYRVPSVTVFGPQSPLRWGPPPDPRHRIVRGGGSAPTASIVPARAVIDHVTDLLAMRVPA
jgi:ADP-heptose:LPS heptosyltransferase